MKFIPSYLLFIIFSGTIVSAQTRPDSLKSEEIDVVRAFVPSVTMVNKVGFPPNLPKISAEQPIPQRYTFTDFSTALNYKAEDLRPLKFSPKATSNESIGFARLGFGNYLTPVVNLALANKNQQKFEVGLLSDFIFSKANNPRFQEYYEFNAKGYGAYHFENTTVGVEAGLRRDQYYLYGYDASLADSISKKDISRAYTLPGINLFFHNHVPTKTDINYKGNFSVEALGTDFNAKGNNIGFGVEGDKGFANGTYLAGLKLSGMFSTYNFEGSDNNLGIELTPYGGINKGVWSLKAGPVLIVNDGDIHLLPYINNSVKVKDNQLVIYNEWNSKLAFNNMISAYRINPFLAANNRFKNYRVQERTFLGARGSFSQGFSYDLRFTQMVWNDAPLWLNDSLDMKQFKQVYDQKITAWNPHIELAYKKAGLFDVRMAADYFIYNTDTWEQAWHMPEFKGLLGGKYYWKDKLQVGLDIMVESGIKARNEQLVVENLAAQVDINLHANYVLNKNIGFFAELNNIANNRNQRWYRYDRFGIHGIAGVKVVF
jgi:hypothetical protein